MVDGRSLDHLILQHGAQVVVCGTLDPVDQSRATLWVVAAWDPKRPGRLTGGDVNVRFAEVTPASGQGFVRVIGTWQGGEIVDATATSIESPSAGYWQAPEGSIAPSELGRERFVELAEELAAHSPAPVIGSGGTRSSMWICVLHVTPELVEAHRGLPVRVDVYASITPAQPDGAYAEIPER
jgi:hypothetical protein